MTEVARVLIKDFLWTSTLAGVSLPEGAITCLDLPAPHKPPSALPKGKMAVYVFFWKDRCLKVGKVGPKSQARYVSQHYNPESSRSNLAKSLLTAQDSLGLPSLSPPTVGTWIKKNLDRMDFLIDAAHGVPVLNLLESFLQCRLKPEFEGFKSQRHPGPE